MSVASSSVRQSARLGNFKEHLKELGWMVKFVVMGAGLMAIASAALPETAPQPKLTYRQPLEQIKLAQPCPAQALSLQPSGASQSSDVQLLDPATYYGCNNSF